MMEGALWRHPGPPPQLGCWSREGLRSAMPAAAQCSSSSKTLPACSGRENGTPEDRQEEGESGLSDGSEREVGVQNDGAGARQGWRALALKEDVTERAKLPRLKRRWRKQFTQNRRFGTAANGALSPSSMGQVPNRDTNLEDLFKSLVSPRGGDRTSAVERYFGGDLERRVTAKGKAGVAAARTTAGANAVVEDTKSGRGRLASDDGASTSAPSDSPEGGGRLRINLELDLYRARCLREEGRVSEAEAILKQCIRDWQDDGRAILELGLLALPLTGDQMNRAQRNSRIGSSREATDTARQTSSANTSITDEGARDGVSTTSNGMPSVIPDVPDDGKRLKINLDLQLYQAKCLRQRGRLDVSEAALRKCIRDWPDDGRPYVALGKQLTQQNRIQEARDVYDSGCQTVRGENPYVWQAWAVLEERAGDVSKARKLFDAATVADKKHVAGWHGWAQLELRAGNVKRARSLLNKGIKFCGPNEYIFQTLALLEYREGNVEEARSLLCKAVQYNPKSAPSWLAWALIEAENDFVETARRLFQKGVQASPKNRYVWQSWALFEAKQGQADRARELFQAGRELNPNDAILLQAYALFEFKCGRPGVARDLFRRALTRDSAHQPVWIAWGWMEWKERNLSVARELYQGAIQADSRSIDAARAFQAWGILEEREGNTGLARELFKCALKIDTQNVPSWMSWAAMEDSEGRAERAEEIRNLYHQQQTEVVEAPWDVDFTDLLAPSIDRIKGLFKSNQRSGQPGTNRSRESNLTRKIDIQDAMDLDVDGESLSSDASTDDEEFDVSTFLRKKFPRKYGDLDTGVGDLQEFRQSTVEDVPM